MLDLERNSHGLSVLTIARARELAHAVLPGGWYIAPFAGSRWTVGLLHDGVCYHVLDDRGEPVQFDCGRDARHYLRLDLNVRECELPELHWTTYPALSVGCRQPSSPFWGPARGIA